MHAPVSDEKTSRLANDLSKIRPANVAFLKTPHRLLIDGAWIAADSGATLEVRDPSSDRVIANVAAGDAIDIDRAVASARRAFEDSAWSQMKPAERERLLFRLADFIERDAETLAELEAIDSGKSITLAQMDIGYALGDLRYMAGWPTKVEGRTPLVSLPSSGQQAYFATSLREPIGVVGAIVPWNYPLVLAMLKVAPALAVGCTVVLKPAEETPLSALRLGTLALEAGIPKGVLNVITGTGPAAGAALAAHPNVDKVSFTGSTEVWRVIVRAAAHNMKKVSLELGGKSPVIIMDDADLETAIVGAADAIFHHQGQVCTAGTRLFVAERHYERVLEGIAQRAGALKVGPGLDPSSEIGPLISSAQRSRVMRYIDEGLASGARRVTGAKAIDSQGYYVQPTVFADVKDDMSIVREEIFGPVLVAKPFSDLREIARMANDTIYGLGASIWTRDLHKIFSLAPKLRSGNVWVNCHGVTDPSMPFGGYKQSGWGRERGREALDSYLESKSFLSTLPHQQAETLVLESKAKFGCDPIGARHAYQ